MTSALRVAKLITDVLTIANVNAWHYWWIYPTGAGNGALWDMGTGQPSKRFGCSETSAASFGPDSSGST